MEGVVRLVAALSGLYYLAFPFPAVVAKNFGHTRLSESHVRVETLLYEKCPLPNQSIMSHYLLTTTTKGSCATTEVPHGEPETGNILRGPRYSFTTPAAVHRHGVDRKEKGKEEKLNRGEPFFASFNSPPSFAKKEHCCEVRFLELCFLYPLSLTEL